VSVDAARRTARRLSVASIGIALLEAALAIPAGVVAGSIALLGFGLDSLIEVGSATTVLWGMSGAGGDLERRELASLRIVGGLLLALAAYVAYESIASIVRHAHPHPSIFGVCVLAGSIVAMLWLRARKRDVAGRLASHAVLADSKQTEFCAYLSAIALAGLGANALFGAWWADPAAALLMVPITAREGIEAAQGRACEHG
jgi:divalent metal cation (Fe/Co/Zn/Cd) transporter